MAKRLILSEFRLKSKSRLGHLGREVEKASRSFMTASVVKCDRFNSISRDPPPQFPISSDMSPTVGASGKFTHIKIIRRYASVCSLDSWIGKTSCHAGLRSGTHQKRLKVRRAALSTSLSCQPEHRYLCRTAETLRGRGVIILSSMGFSWTCHPPGKKSRRAK
jgi:hypothetical protein